MKISQIFHLNKSQGELDFVDIDIDRDTPLFIDPFFISIRTDNWSFQTNRTIKVFFQNTINLIRQGQIEKGRALFNFLDEPNSTCLGLSSGLPKGKGVGDLGSKSLFDNIAKSHAMETGLIQDIEDNILFIEGFGKDKLSDMTTNIITNHLIEYTQKQCQLNNIPLLSNIPSGFYWNRKSLQWEQRATDMLVINDKKVLLVPKGIVSFCKNYTPDKYYYHFVLNFMQSEHLRINSALVQKRKNGEAFVTKKDLKEKNPFSKEFVADFSRRNPIILESFKMRTQVSSLNNHDITDININDLCKSLIIDLQELPAGSENATKFHRLATGILEMIFYPQLIYPTLEQEIHNGRKRIDLTFDNASHDGFFCRLSQNLKLPCQYIMVECKNYSSDINNPELDQLAGRFSPNRGQVGFIVCRIIENLEVFINRCRDTYRDNRGLIIPLTDKDLIDLLNNHNEFNSDYSDKFFSDRIRSITIN